MSKYIDGVGEVAAPSSAKERLKNFWYHYKWHTVAALAAILIAVICVLQFCSKESYDMQILYAGGKVIGKTESETDVAEIVKVTDTLSRFADDFNGDGKTNVNISNYYYLSAEDIAELGGDVNHTLLADDEKAITGVMEHSNIYLCFVSVDVYNAYKGNDGSMFVSLREFEGLNGNAEFYADNAIYLSSLEFYNTPGIENLPDDTLVCIKAMGLLASRDDEHIESFNNAKAVLEKILKYQ